MSDYDTIYAAEKDIALGPHGWVQWKGTEVCIDIHCDCGERGHYDGDFAYAVRCRNCGKIWALGQCVKLLPLTEKQAEGFNVKEMNDPESLI
jgi:hypothetical protein